MLHVSLDVLLFLYTARPADDVDEPPDLPCIDE